MGEPARGGDGSFGAQGHKVEENCVQLNVDCIHNGKEYTRTPPPSGTICKGCPVGLCCSWAPHAALHRVCRPFYKRPAGAPPAAPMDSCTHTRQSLATPHPNTGLPGVPPDLLLAGLAAVGGDFVRSRFIGNRPAASARMASDREPTLAAAVGVLFLLQGVRIRIFADGGLIGAHSDRAEILVKGVRLELLAIVGKLVALVLLKPRRRIGRQAARTKTAEKRLAAAKEQPQGAGLIFRFERGKC